MEIGSSALSGAMKVGVQIVVARKRPVLEVYQQARNRFGPEVEYRLDQADPSWTDRIRHQEIFVELVLLNIGAERAENVSFELSGAFARESGVGDRPSIFHKSFRQFSPGQNFYLMNIEQFDLLNYIESEEHGSGVSISNGLKDSTLNIVIHYDGPDTLVNRILRWPRRLMGKKQYSSEFLFDPQFYQGDLPPAEYA